MTMTKSRGYTWVGMRCECIAEQIRIYEELFLTRPVVSPSKKYALFRLESLQDFELIGIDSRWSKYHSNPVIGFETECIDSTLRLITKHDIFCTDVVCADGWGKFSYVKFNEYLYFQIIQRSSPLLVLSRPHIAATIYYVNPHLLLDFLSKFVAFRIVDPTDTDSVCIELADGQVLNLINGRVLQVQLTYCNHKECRAVE